jgi:isopentenyl-diphosphate delta-isomerase
MPAAEDQLIVVNEQDTVLGSDSKSRCHAGRGVLHRGFSVYLFDREGRLLIQQRSSHKPLWPLHWSNSCCSHPRWGEKVDAAAHRRVREELGLAAQLRLAFKFRYHAAFEGVGSEREICSVFIGTSDGEVRANPREVADWRFIDCDEFDQELVTNAGAYTPWFQIGWQQLRRDRWPEVEAL